AGELTSPERRSDQRLVASPFGSEGETPKLGLERLHAVTGPPVGGAALGQLRGGGARRGLDQPRRRLRDRIRERAELLVLPAIGEPGPGSDHIAAVGADIDPGPELARAVADLGALGEPVI